MASSELLIRPIQPEDVSTVRSIFRRGMWDNYNMLVWHALRAPEAAAVTAAMPLAAALLLKSQPWHWLAAGVAAGALALPLTIAAVTYAALRQYVNGSLADDLADIPSHYPSDKGSQFWVAEAGGRVVGCVALQRKSPGEGELRRMSVTPGLRGLGVGSKLATTLISHAHGLGYKNVHLTTTSAQVPALRLYSKLGWQTTKIFRYERVYWMHRLDLDVPLAVARLGLK